MKTIEYLLGSEKGRSAVVLGAGATIKEYKKQIDKFIKRTNSFIIGINNVVDLWVPDYHVWTNNQRFRDFGQHIKEESTVLLGSNISIKVVNSILKEIDYIILNRVDREGVSIKYKNGTIYGYFRTAGCLSIMIASLLGADEINVVGMDGYTLHSREDVQSGKKSQHCYGEGFTDTATWETCIEKDKIIYNSLQNIRNYGVDFKILTPTKYRRFYDSARLHV